MTITGKDTVLEQIKREEKSHGVIIQFVSPISFKVLDENQQTKYVGNIDIEKSVEDLCSCMSFHYGMKYEMNEDGSKGESDYVRTHGTAFQCKHIIRAKNIRKLGMIDDARDTPINVELDATHGKGRKL